MPIEKPPTRTYTVTWEDGKWRIFLGGNRLGGFHHNHGGAVGIAIASAKADVAEGLAAEVVTQMADGSMRSEWPAPKKRPRPRRKATARSADRN